MACHCQVGGGITTQYLQVGSPARSPFARGSPKRPLVIHHQHEEGKSGIEGGGEPISPDASRLAEILETIYKREYFSETPLHFAWLRLDSAQARSIDEAYGRVREAYDQGGAFAAYNKAKEAFQINWDKAYIGQASTEEIPHGVDAKAVEHERRRARQQYERQLAELHRAILQAIREMGQQSKPRWMQPSGGANKGVFGWWSDPIPTGEHGEGEEIKHEDDDADGGDHQQQQEQSVVGPVVAQEKEEEGAGQMDTALPPVLVQRQRVPTHGSSTHGSHGSLEEFKERLAHAGHQQAPSLAEEIARRSSLQLRQGQGQQGSAGAGDDVGLIEPIEPPMSPSSSQASSSRAQLPSHYTPLSSPSRDLVDQYSPAHPSGLTSPQLLVEEEERGGQADDGLQSLASVDGGRRVSLQDLLEWSPERGAARRPSSTINPDTTTAGAAATGITSRPPSSSSLSTAKAEGTPTNEKEQAVPLAAASARAVEEGKKDIDTSSTSNHPPSRRGISIITPGLSEASQRQKERQQRLFVADQQQNHHHRHSGSSVTAPLLSEDSQQQEQIQPHRRLSEASQQQQPQQHHQTPLWHEALLAQEEAQEEKAGESVPTSSTPALQPPPPPAPSSRPSSPTALVDQYHAFEVVVEEDILLPPPPAVQAVVKGPAARQQYGVGARAFAPSRGIYSERQERGGEEEEDDVEVYVDSQRSTSTVPAIASNGRRPSMTMLPIQEEGGKGGEGERRGSAGFSSVRGPSAVRAGSPSTTAAEQTTQGLCTVASLVLPMQQEGGGGGRRGSAVASSVRRPSAVAGSLVVENAQGLSHVASARSETATSPFRIDEARGGLLDDTVPVGEEAEEEHHHRQHQQHLHGSRWRVRIEKDGSVEAEDLGDGVRGGGNLSSYLSSSFPSPSSHSRTATEAEGGGDKEVHSQQQQHFSPLRSSYQEKDYAIPSARASRETMTTLPLHPTEPFSSFSSSWHASSPGEQPQQQQPYPFSPSRQEGRQDQHHHHYYHPPADEAEAYGRKWSSKLEEFNAEAQLSMIETLIRFMSDSILVKENTDGGGRKEKEEEEEAGGRRRSSQKANRRSSQQEDMDGLAGAVEDVLQDLDILEEDEEEEEEVEQEEGRDQSTSPLGQSLSTFNRQHQHHQPFASLETIITTTTTTRPTRAGSSNSNANSSRGAGASSPPSNGGQSTIRPRGSSRSSLTSPPPLPPPTIEEDDDDRSLASGTGSSTAAGGGGGKGGAARSSKSPSPPPPPLPRPPSSATSSTLSVGSRRVSLSLPSAGPMTSRRGSLALPSAAPLAETLKNRRATTASIIKPSSAAIITGEVGSSNGNTTTITSGSSGATGATTTAAAISPPRYYMRTQSSTNYSQAGNAVAGGGGAAAGGGGRRPSSSGSSTTNSASAIVKGKASTTISPPPRKWK